MWPVCLPSATSSQSSTVSYPYDTLSATGTWVAPCQRSPRSPAQTARVPNPAPLFFSFIATSEALRVCQRLQPATDTGAMNEVISVAKTKPRISQSVQGVGTQGLRDLT